MYGMQVKTNWGWEWVHPGNKHIPYKYETETEAEKMLNMCYPDQVREHKLGGKQVVRVRKFNLEV